MNKFRKRSWIVNPFGMLFTLFVAFLVSSCSTEESFNHDSKKQLETDVLAHIQAVNTELLANKPVENATRGWTRWTNRERTAVVAADLRGAYDGGKVGARIGANIGTLSGQPITGGVFGAVLGGAISGAYCSWLLFPNRVESIEINDADFNSIKTLCKGMVIDGYLPIDTLIVNNIDNLMPNELGVPQNLVDMTGLDRNSIIVGKMHNIILASLDGSFDFHSGSVPMMSSGGEPTTPPDFNDDYAYRMLQEEIAESPVFLAECKTSAENVYNGEAVLSNRTIDSILALFIDVLENYSSETTDVAYIISRYTEIIDQSTELSDEDKEQLKQSFATALYSSTYWDNRLN